MDTKYTRTTVTLPENLLFEAKRWALTERKTLKEVIEAGLNLYLYSGKTRSAAGINSLFGAWGKGKSGKDYLKQIRNDKNDKDREEYLQKLWKKS